ncbi:PEGA domain-containing protein [Methanoculleus sp.]|uniref:PEGA domain-containing protein n=1 Tax=Methanoculleus sp. TaxID=90427 RepID=UPI002FC75A87
MTIEVNDEVVYSESGFSSSDPANQVPKEFHADFPQSETVRVKISHGQNPAWSPRFAMEYYSFELHQPPPITITSPHDDTVPAGGNVTVSGNVSDTAITSLILTHNNVSSTVPVQGGNFSTEVTLADANTITVGGTDSLGNPFSTTLLLDGDMLPAAFEQAIGFDPLNADSDCAQWPGDQAGNGVIDGYEVFAGDLPVFVKYRIGANPFVEDTDGDNLTDSFELLKLGTFPEEPGQMLLMGDGDPVIVAAGTDDDPDGDGLSNLDEQTYGTDPLSADTDDDGLADADEILMGTDPCDADTDSDGLTDGAEVALGTTSPFNPDSDSNGVADGAEDYWSGERFLDETLNLTVFGRGYAVANVSVAAVNYTHLISDEILVSKVAAIGFGDDIGSGTIEIAYNPTHVVDPSRLAIYRFDEDLGTFVGVASAVDAVNGVVSCAAAGSAKYAVLDSARWEALFDEDESIESLGETDIYHVLLWVRDSQTGEGVGNASVTFWGVTGSQDLVTKTHETGERKGLTRDFAEYPTSGAKAYSIEKNGYNNHNGVFHIKEGEYIFTATSLIHQVGAPTGYLTVTSTPTGAIVYIDNIYYGSGVSNAKLLEGEHTLVLTSSSLYYGTAIETVEITRNQHTQKHINLPLTSSCGNVRVICSEPGAAVSIDGFSVGTIPASGELTETNVDSGTRQVTVTKEGFASYYESVTVVAGQTSTVNVVLVPEDLDGDGLPDGFETGGYTDGFGNRHNPDPYLIDTDGDGLSDGFEAGEPVTDENGKTYFKQRSDPTKADTDDDGLDDLAEFEYGTDPFNPDTDGDGLRDGADPDPLTPAASGDINLAKIGREILAGAVFGETGLPDGSLYWLVGEETASSPYYMVGWIGFSCLPVVGGVADIRDAVQAILNGDPVGAIPGPGDAVKVAAVVGKFVLKLPELLMPAAVLLISEIPDPDVRAIAGASRDAPSGVECSCRRSRLSELEDLRSSRSPPAPEGHASPFENCWAIFSSSGPSARRS